MSAKLPLALLTSPAVSLLPASLYFQYSLSWPLTEDSTLFPLRWFYPTVHGWATATQGWYQTQSRTDQIASRHTGPSSATRASFRCPCLEHRDCGGSALMALGYMTLSAAEARSECSRKVEFLRQKLPLMSYITPLPSCRARTPPSFFRCKKDPMLMQRCLWQCLFIVAGRSREL